MNSKQKKILDVFLENYPEYQRAEWDGKLAIYFPHKPQEPFTVAEFMDGSATKRILTQVSILLEEAEKSSEE